MHMFFLTALLKPLVLGTRAPHARNLFPPYTLSTCTERQTIEDLPNSSPLREPPAQSFNGSAMDYASFAFYQDLGTSKSTDRAEVCCFDA